MGFKPRYLEYQAKGMYYVKDGAPFYNVEVTLSSAENQDDGIIVVGAHYDTAPGTRGADDNASGVAVLIELARIFKINNQKREIRLVAFGTEEPPAFGTQNMGSFHYAQKLKNENIKVKGMISLEMLGYYNPKKGSQLYPPFLHLFFPNHGNFIALVSNFSSRSFLKSLSYKWDKNSFPLVTATLPTVFSGITLSDQLNFWDAGFPAVMLTDTSFFRNPHYHQETDTPEKLNYENMALITKTLADVLTNIK
jgi:Zn-dependent M28 family amino/carboxypeptidase